MTNGLAHIANTQDSARGGSFLRMCLEVGCSSKNCWTDRDAVFLEGGGDGGADSHGQKESWIR